MPSVNATKLTIGGPESPVGTPAARTHVIPVRSLATVGEKAEKLEDPAIIGRNMASGSYPVALDVTGAIPITPRPCGAFGKILHSVLGNASAGVQVAGCMRVRYIGGEDSCYMVADNTGNTLKSYVGDLDVEALDDGFGTPGYQEWGLTGKTGLSDTGLANDTDYKVKITIDVGAETEYTVHTPATGTVTFNILIGLLNTEAADQTTSIVGGDMRTISHTVGDDSDILLAAGTSSDLLAALSATPDAAVSGVSGIVDFDDARYNTIEEIVALVDSLTNYECEKIAGSDSFDVGTNKVQAFTTKEAGSTWCYVWFLSSDSGIYKHEFFYQTAATEHPTYSVQADGYQDNFLFTGAVVDSLSLKGALKGFVEGDVNILGFLETGSQEASTEVLEDVDPMIFQKGGFAIGEKEFNYVRDLSLSLENNHMKDGYGMGSLSRQYQQKGKFKGSGTANIRLDADSFALRAFTKTGGRTSLSFYCTGKNLAADIPELVVVELPYISYDGYEPRDNGGVIDAGFNFGIVYPKGTLYSNPVTVTILTKESGTY